MSPQLPSFCGRFSFRPCSVLRSLGGGARLDGVDVRPAFVVFGFLVGEERDLIVTIEGNEGLAFRLLGTATRLEFCTDEGYVCPLLLCRVLCSRFVLHRRFVFFFCAERWLIVNFLRLVFFYFSKALRVGPLRGVLGFFPCDGFNALLGEDRIGLLLLRVFYVGGVVVLLGWIYRLVLRGDGTNERLVAHVRFALAGSVGSVLRERRIAFRVVPNFRRREGRFLLFFVLFRLEAGIGLPTVDRGRVSVVLRNFYPVVRRLFGNVVFVGRRISLTGRGAGTLSRSFGRDLQFFTTFYRIMGNFLPLLRGVDSAVVLRYDLLDLVVLVIISSAVGLLSKCHPNVVAVALVFCRFVLRD